MATLRVAPVVLVELLEVVVEEHRLLEVLLDAEAERALGADETQVVVAEHLGLHHLAVREAHPDRADDEAHERHDE